ncbi:WD40 repeat-like protein, partial [Thozetella sp. PMI_491]
LKGHDESIVSMSFSPNSELLASASRGAVEIWQVRRGLPVATIRAQSALVAFSPDSSSLASISPGNVVRLWNAKRIQNLSDIQDHLDRASFENYDLYKQRLPVDTDVATLMIWDVGRARPLTLLSVDKTEILSVSFSEDSGRIGSISADHILRIWDVETGKCLETI